MDKLIKISTLLETYRIHDSVIGLIGYKCGMISGCLKKNNRLAISLKNLSSQISNARVILRLLDDYSMLTYTLSYGLGKAEKNVLVRILTILGNLSSHVYYIAEHIAFIADNKLINIDSGLYWLISILAWLISIITQILCNLISLFKIISNHNSKRTNVFLKKDCIKLYFKLFEDIFWIVNCIGWLPPGFLWSSKLSDFKSGLFGVLAVSCSLIAKLQFA